MRMTPAQLKKSRRAKPVDREGPLQIEIVQWLRAALPDGCLVHHCRNEIKRGGYSFAKEQARARALGTISGWPDLLVVTYVGTFFLEVKVKGNYAQPNQKEVHSKLAKLGANIAVVRSIDDTRACLIEWGVWFVEPVR